MEVWGVRRMMEFKIALLEKWCWGIVVYNVGLWFRMLSSRYGVEGVI